MRNALKCRVGDDKCLRIFGAFANIWKLNMNQDNTPPRPGDVRSEPLTGALMLETFAPTVWEASSYAPEWFRDAEREAGQTGRESRRREILFAVCAAESYIFEWVRDDVLARNFTILAGYFPPGAKRGVKAKFREIPKQLASDGRVRAALNCGGREFSDFRQLVDFRDGLVHASASRPATSGPVPSTGELDALPAGWATGVVRTLLQKLHGDTGTQQPPWL